MTRVKALGLALVAVFAMSAVAVASASAFTQFHGSPVGGTIEGKALENQVFKVNAGETICKKLTTPESKVTAEKAETQAVNVKYEECTSLGFKTTISTAHYLFNAKTGKVKIEAPGVTIKVEPGIGNCEIKVPAQEVGTVTYANNGKNLKITPNPVEAITYTTTGGTCGAGGSNGTYKGAAEATVNKGEGLVECGISALLGSVVR